MLYPKPNYTFPILVGVLFVLRGLQLQCLYPPLEGPDEYQHIAYMVYLLEEHKIPVYGKAMVPKSLYTHLLANPHCNHDWEQTHGIGCLRYKDFYNQQPQQTGDPNISLYQAQQAPLYYVLFYHVYGWAKGVFGFRGAVYTLRIINVIFGALAIVLFVSPLNGIFKDRKLIRLGVLAVGLLPMFMTYVSRVTCDALAMAFAGVAVYLLTRMADRRYLVIKAAIIGGLIGLGVLTKLIVICVLPVSLVYFAYLAFVSRMPRLKAIICSLALIGSYLVLTLHYHWQNYHDVGTIFPYANTISNVVAGKTFLDLAKQIRFEHLRTVFVAMLVRLNLWTSGWSFLLPNRVFVKVYDWILVISLLGLVPNAVILFRQKFQKSLCLPPNLVLCGLLMLFSFLMVYAQILNSIITYGQIVTVSYYVMIGYPAFLICVLVAARGYGKDGVSVAAIAMILLFLVTEYHSVLGIAVQHWTNATNLRQIFERLASVHPAFPSPWFFFPFAVAVCLLTLILIIIAVLSCNLVHDEFFTHNPTQDQDKHGGCNNG